MFWIAALLATWIAMRIIFRYEVGAEKAAEIRKEKNGFQRFFYIGYAKYVKEKPIAFFILRWQFYLGILALLLFLLACIENFLRATEVYAFIAMGMLAIAALASSGVDNTRTETENWQKLLMRVWRGIALGKNCNKSSENGTKKQSSRIGKNRFGC